MKPEPKPPVEVIPSVTRWFTSNGVDTIYVTAGVKVTVPHNLAEHLKRVGYAREV
jgi:protein-L-isoaspartate O-methyltransferase